MNDIVNLLQNDPLVFVVWAIAAVSLVLLFLFAIYFNFIPAKIASQYRQIRERPIVYFGAIGILIALLLIVFAMASGPSKQKEETREAEFKTEGKITAIDSVSKTVTIQQTGSTRAFEFKISEDVKYKQAWSDKKLSENDLLKGVVIEVTSYEPLESETISDADNIFRITIFPNPNTLPSDPDNLPKLQLDKEGSK